MKKTILLLVLINWFCISFAQVGINTTTPAAQLEIKASNQATPSNTDGIIIPKVDAFPVTNPTAAQQGMIVYLTTTNASNTPGFYYWDNLWKPISETSGTGWNLTGNAGTNPTSNFIGTTDNNDLVIKRNNIESGIISESNTAFGYQSLFVNDFGSQNTAVGALSLSSSDNSTDNTAIGFNSMFNNGPGNKNTAVGSLSLSNLVSGNENTAIGYQALKNNYIGSDNVAIGSNALTLNNNSLNIAIGKNALSYDTFGQGNIAIGVYSMASGVDNTGLNNAVDSNVAIGHATLTQCGFRNVAIGPLALNSPNGRTNDNTAIGYHSMKNNYLGTRNTALGSFSLSNNLLGDDNTAIGYNALLNSTGNLNTVIGVNSLNNINGNNNIGIGNYTDLPNPNGDNQMTIGDVIYGTDMGSIFDGKIGIGVAIPTEKLDVNGKTKTTDLQVTNGANLGDVLTSDALGNATWQTPATTNYWTATGNNISNNNSDNVGIGTTNPTAKLEVNGFTKLGNDAPAIKVKKLTGTTSAFQNGDVSINHGLNINNILSVSVSVLSNGFLIPASYSRNGYEFDFYTNVSAITIWNTASNSANILSQPFTILITYEE